MHLDPSPFETGQPFRQVLCLRDATVKVRAGGAGRSTDVNVWVDANSPAIHMDIESAEPCEATASIELWRTSRYEVTELQASDVLLDSRSPGGRRGPIVVEPDTVLSGLTGRIGWYHRNARSVGPRLLAEVQGLTGYPQPDPLLGRTFGALVSADGGERIDDLRLRSPRSRRHRFTAVVLTRASVDAPGLARGR